MSGNKDFTCTIEQLRLTPENLAAFNKAKAEKEKPAAPTFDDFLREQMGNAQEQDAAARGIYPATEEEWTETVATLQQRISDLEEDLDIVHDGLRRSAAEHDYKASKDIARDALMEYAVVQLKRAGLLDGVKTMVVDISQCGRCDGCDDAGS